MNVLIIYDSLYGNTEKITKEISRTLSKNNSVKALRVGEADIKDFESVELLIVGSPTQGGRPKKETEEFLKQIPHNKLVNVKVAAFDTRMDQNDQGVGLKLIMKVIDFAAPKIAKTLTANGGKLVGKPEGFIVEGKEGPLRKGELKRAAEWANTLS